MTNTKSTRSVKIDIIYKKPTFSTFQGFQINNRPVKTNRIASNISDLETELKIFKPLANIETLISFWLCELLRKQYRFMAKKEDRRMSTSLHRHS